MADAAIETKAVDNGVEPPGRRDLGRQFWRMWTADLASGLGEGIRVGALPLLAVSLDYSPSAVAFVWFAGGLPFVLVGPFSGVVTDRWRNHRKMMWISDAVATAAALVFALLVATGGATIAALIVFNFLIGSIATLRDNAATAVVPHMVPPHLLDKANSRVQGVQTLTIDLIGPPLGALMFALPNGLPFFLDALSFAIAGILVFGLVTPRVVPEQREPLRAAGIVADITAGMRWLWRNRLLRALCLVVGLVTMAVFSAISVAVLYAFEVLHVGRTTYVILLAVIALGAVLGSLLAPVMSDRLGRAATLRISLAAAPVAFAVAALTSSAVVATAALTVVGAIVGVCNVIAVSLRHVLVPEELMGRVNSSYRLVAVGMGPLGALVAGFSAEMLGLRAPFLFSAAAAATALVIALRQVSAGNIDRALDPASAGAPAPKRRRRLWLRILAWFLTLVTVVVAGSAVYVTWTVRRSFPTTAGQVAVPGLEGKAEVVRDRFGVPQIYASSPDDLFLAQGYVHAQDRFWQMDVQRHITAGRLSELFGESEVETDKVVRTLGWRRVAQKELALLSPDTRSHLQSYADGVNAYLKERGGARLSAEYAVLGLVNGDYSPQPWTPVDSVAWLKAMSWSLRGNMDEELQRSLLAAELPLDRVAQLYPGYDFATQRPIVPDTGGTRAGDDTRPSVRSASGSGMEKAGDIGRVTAALDRVLGPSGPGIGSNSWVVAGSRTKSGKPILANDPHLGPQSPSIWYQTGLHCTKVDSTCPYDVTGFGFAGMPAVFIGHNRQITWGLTNLGADVTDLVLEKVDGGTYEYRGEKLPLRTRKETIKVAGGDPVTFTVRATRHGPIISNAIDDVRKAGEHGRSPAVPASPGGHAVALRWTALEPSATVDSVFAINRASDWKSFREALRGFSAPAQNVVYADRAGHIGYQAIGSVPVRTKGDGTYPVPGWTGRYEWKGNLPFDELPRSYDPADGYIVTANNAATGPGYPHLITKDWSDGHRSERITELLEQAGPLDTEDMRRIQRDSRSPFAEALVPYLLRVRPGPEAEKAWQLLKGWDYEQPVDSAAAAYFNAVWRALVRLTFTDDLKRTRASHEPDGGGRWLEVVRSLLRNPDDPYWSDGKDLKTRDDVLRKALDEAAAELTGRLGDDPGEWRWGSIHRLTLKESTLGTGGPAPVRWLLDRGPYELPGGSSAVNANSWYAPEGYEVDWIPSMRMVVDLSDWDASGWINSGGVSGHAFHPNYTDQTGLWAKGETTRWPFTRAAVSADRDKTLTLTPTS
ncbi:MFS transporter [Streptomyces sp. NPDC046862]|uniref:MFS transporter n=1 Tax=Streptomyces sp. NPDC046862 TaxID=3154603 RepID=UPI00345572E6